MSAFAGTRALIAFDLRRDRVMIPVYLAVLVGLIVSTAAQSETLYSTPAARADYAATVGANPGMIALVGPTYAVTNVGGDTAWQWGGIGAVVAALMSMVLVGRHTRTEEQEGRSELVRASAVGRFAPMTAALVVVAATNLLLAALVAVALIGQDLDPAGALALGASLAGAGLVFAGVAAVSAQISQTTSGAYGLVGAALGAAYVLRASGDVGDGTLSWLSPVGWAQSMRPFAGERWWPLGLALAAAAALVALAYRLLDRRDDGAGAIAPRPGRPAAGPRLAMPAGLSLRLTRGPLLGWATGLLLTGVSIGAIAEDAQSVLGDSQEVNDLLGQAGGSLVDQYLAICLLSLAQVGTAYAIQVLLRMRSEETAGRLESLLATALGRRGWAGGYLAIAALGSVVVVGAGGLGAGVADALVAGDGGKLPRLLGASLAYVPAVWVIAGLTLALVGFAPRAASAAWGALAACYALAYLGPLLSLPAWVLDLSPYTHLPLVPGDDFDLVPLAWLTAVAAALGALGLVTLRRRDIGATRA